MLYNKEIFIAEISESMKVSVEVSEKLCQQILGMRFPNNTSWTDFNTTLKEVLSDFIMSVEVSEKLCLKILDMKFSNKTSWTDFDTTLKEVFSDFLSSEKNSELIEVTSTLKMSELPDIDNINDYEGIIKYLNAIKGLNIEHNLKVLFLNSQLEENEKYNYFACIFNKLIGRERGKDWDSFICCYSQLLLTQKVSHLMLNWLIYKYAKLCSNGLDTSLRSDLNGDTMNYEEYINRTYFLRLVFALRLIDRDDPKGMSERAKNLLMSTFGADDYNPRSFLDMTYYYGIMRLDSLEELDKMFVTLIKLVLVNLFSGYINEDEITSYVDNMAPTTNKKLSKIKSFLDFDHDSLEMCSSLIENENIYILAERKFREMGVKDFHSDINKKQTFTYAFYKENVEPKIESYNTDEFCKWMAENPRFYEKYYGEYSLSRDLEFNQTDFDDVQMYAYKIVHKNVLSNSAGDEKFRVSGYPGVKITDLKAICNLSSSKEMLSEIKRIIEPSLEFIRNYEGESLKAEKIRVYAEVDIDSLCAAIMDEILRSKTNDQEITRSEFLFRKFKEFAESKNDDEDGADFLRELNSNIGDDDDKISTMQFLRWEPINYNRYHDALLYMCLNCKNPPEMFKKVNNTEGYSYNYH